MKLSTKGRYAMVALADLAMADATAGGDDLVSLAAISKRQDISLPYLEQLFVKLRRAGLVEAVRGPQPGRDPHQRGDGGGGGDGGRDAHRSGGERSRVRVKGAVADQPAVGKPVGERLRLPASGAPVGCGEERSHALPGGAAPVSRGV